MFPCTDHLLLNIIWGNITQEHFQHDHNIRNQNKNYGLLIHLMHSSSPLCALFLVWLVEDQWLRGVIASCPWGTESVRMVDTFCG